VGTSTALTKIQKILYVHDFHPRQFQREGNILSTDHASRVKYFEPAVVAVTCSALCFAHKWTSLYCL